MKKIINLLVILIIISCNSPKKEQQQGENNQQEKDKTIVKPKEKWDVHKEYDEFGNLIKYDSIYLWSYSNVKGDSLRVNLDSIMNSFKVHFDENSPFKWNEDFSFFPKKDSLFMSDFFKEDYFLRNWKTQHAELEKMIKRMDAERNAFLKKYHPGLLQSRDNN
ncbi:hypothetical protein [Polaribacter sp. SA4-12]|uniref:hypothetical protein n=1 Tax=Polaribacter sp. SA4-12 TaxID=1312072 RepID=UPI000B3CFCA5|nr:hypothetical protein [Polaribacter sp. SA4-12]ARV14789.1 hypothetical protein BTO07_06335 [Polaribacter sp. SA4-12]